jgi:ankyrin repeat protein
VAFVIFILFYALTTFALADESPKILLKVDNHLQSNTHLIVDGYHLTIMCSVEQEWGHIPDKYDWMLDGKVIGSGDICSINIPPIESINEPSSEAKHKDYNISCTRSGTTVNAFLTVEGLSQDKYLRSLLGTISVSEVDKILTLNNTLANTIDYRTNCMTPLHVACWFKKPDMVQCLIKHGAKLDARDYYGATPLIYACKFDDVQCALDLISAGASVNILDSDGSSALHYAVQSGNVELVQALIKSKAHINTQNNSWMTPLHLAVLNHTTAEKQLKIVNALLKGGASDTLIENKNGYTPLELALINHDEQEVISALIADPALNFQAVDFNGNGYLNEAIMAQYGTEIITDLINHGCNPDLGNNDGVTPLHAAAQSSKLLTEFFLKKGINIDITCQNGETPLFCAVLANKEDIVNYLIQAGADILIKAGSQSLLFSAVASGNLDLVKLFLGKGFNVNDQDDEGGSLLMEAVRMNHPDILTYLLSHTDVNLDMQNILGYTALYYAVKFGYNKTAKILIAYHANVNIKDKKGISVIQLAEQSQNDEILMLLRQNGAKE